MLEAAVENCFWQVHAAWVKECSHNWVGNVDPCTATLVTRLFIPGTHSAPVRSVGKAGNA